MQRMNKIDDCLNLSPIIKDYIEYQLLEQDEEKGKYTIKSGMNFITWLWGSGKTFFIEETLKHLKEPKDYLWERKFIRIDFSPRNLETTASIYSHFLDTFISELLSEKYAPNLKGYKSNLLKILGAWTGNNYLDMFFKLFNSPSENVQDILKSINNSLQTTYKDCFVVVVIDDIDRVEKKDLLNIGKILNLLKNLTSIQKEDKDKNKSNPNLICFYSADSNYLNNFYQYFNKFRDSQIDIYEATYKNLITFLKKSILKIKDNKGIQSKLYLCNKLFDSLKEKDIAVTIRDLLFLKKEILGKFQQNIDKTKENLEKYNDIIPEENIDPYFYSESNRVNIFLLYLYIKSLYEKDSYILPDLDFYYSDIFTPPIDTTTYEEEKRTEITNKYTFIFDDLNLNNLKDKETYDLIKKWILNQNNPEAFSNYVIDRWISFISEEIRNPDFHKIDKFPQIVYRLFFPLEHRNNSVMNSIIEDIPNDKIAENPLAFSNFFNNYIEIIKEYLKVLCERDRQNLNARGEFIANTVQFFWIFTDIKVHPIGEDWSRKEVRSEKIKTLLKEIQKNDNIVYQFIFLYLILRTHSYSIEENKKDLKNLVESFSLYEIVNDEDASIVNLTKDCFKNLANFSWTEKGLMKTLQILLYNLIHRDWKNLPLLKWFWEEYSILLLIYSMICYLQSPIQFFPWNRDKEEHECYKKIYQELMISKWWDIKDLIEECKDEILIRNGEVNHPREPININFLRDLEDKISIEDISNSLNKFYWTDSN